MSLYKDASLVMLPSAVKDGKLYSIRPTDGSGDFTFSRGSNLAATRVDVNGLIEKGRENLVLQSNQFDTTWGKQNATLTSNQSGYNGNNAWFVQSNTANGGHRVTQTISASGVYTFSIYAKAGGYNYLALYSAGQLQGRYFDLANGTIGNTMLGTPVDSKIESVGGDWYRCSVTFAGTETSIEMWMSESGSSYLFTGDGTSGVYIQDAQLESGLVATDVISTGASTAQAGILEDLPRLDYSGGASCPSLLLEPQRTNFIPHSEYFSDWALDGNGASQSVTANYATSPEGVQNASRLQLNKTGGTYSRIRKSVTASYSGAGIFSVYLKTNDASTKNISMRWAGSGAIEKTITGEWQRFNVQGTATSGLASDCEIFVVDSQNSIVDLSIYAAQNEAGSYPTSYIPTYGSAVTRSEDDCEVASVSDLIGQTEGTMFVEAKVIFDIRNGRIMLLHSIFNQFIELVGLATRKVQAFVYNGSVQANIQSTTLYSSGDTLKIAFAYKANDFVLYINGVQEGTDTSGSLPSTMSKIILNNYTASGYSEANGYKQALLFKTRLTNAELAALTA